MGQISYFKNYFQEFFDEDPNFLFILFENDSLKNLQKSVKDLVTIWDPPVKFDIGFVILVVISFLIPLVVLSW